MGEIKNIPLDRLAVDSYVGTQIWGSYPGHMTKIHCAMIFGFYATQMLSCYYDY